MYYFDKRLQWPVKVEKPDPLFARMLQQAIGGVEGEIRVCMQYFFQAWGARGPSTKYRDMLLHTATEEIGHIEMLATAVALNLDKAPVTEQEAGAADGIVGSIMGGGDTKGVIEGMLHRHILSTGLAAYPADADGVPFNMSHTISVGSARGMIFGPPSEVGARADFGLALGEIAAPRTDRVHEVIYRGHELVDDGLVHQPPKRLGGLQFRTVGRQVDQRDPVWHGEVGTGEPPRVSRRLIGLEFTPPSGGPQARRRRLLRLRPAERCRSARAACGDCTSRPTQVWHIRRPRTTAMDPADGSPRP